MEGFWCLLKVLYSEVCSEWFNALVGMPEMYLYGWSVKRKKGKTWRILSFFQVSKHYFILHQVSSFHILTPLNTSLVYNKCHEAWPVKKCHSHSSHSELRPSTTSDTGGGKWEKRIQSVKNTLKNSSHTPFHLGERERDRNMEVKQMRRKSSVCVFFFSSEISSAQSIMTADLFHQDPVVPPWHWG